MGSIYEKSKLGWKGSSTTTFLFSIWIFRNKKASAFKGGEEVDSWAADIREWDLVDDDKGAVLFDDSVKKKKKIRNEKEERSMWDEHTHTHNKHTHIINTHQHTHKHTHQHTHTHSLIKSKF